MVLIIGISQAELGLQIFEEMGQRALINVNSVSLLPPAPLFSVGEEEHTSLVTIEDADSLCGPVRRRRADDERKGEIGTVLTSEH